MHLPFSREQFFDVFGRYNESLWPAQLILIAIATFCVGAAVFGRAQRAIPWALAFLWGWMAIAYHFAFFAAINAAAWVFGAAFLGASALFARHAMRATLGFRAVGWRRAAALVLIVYALLIYPLVGKLVGHAYPRSPTFGLPCPTTIFTLGMLLLAKRPVPWSLFVIPIGWSFVGTFAALALGVPQDLGLPAAVLIALVTLAFGDPNRGLRRRDWLRRRTQRIRGATPAA